MEEESLEKGKSVPHFRRERAFSGFGGEGLFLLNIQAPALWADERYAIGFQFQKMMVDVGLGCRHQSRIQAPVEPAGHRLHRARLATQKSQDLFFSFLTV